MSEVPAFLIARDRWLLWRKEQRRNARTGEITETKPPISFHTGKKCDAGDPKSWTSFANITAALTKNGGAWDGPGFALGALEHPDELIIGLDCDSCIAADGALAPWAMDWLAAVNSYTEHSPSGTGLKSIARLRRADLAVARKLLAIAEGSTDQARTRTFGPKPPGGGHAPGVQLFLARRFFTITGQRWHAAPPDVRLLTVGQIAQLAALCGRSEPAGNHESEQEPDAAALRARLDAELACNRWLRERWVGGTEGLRDTTRSGRDMAVVAALKAAGFTKGEARAALLLFEHGKAKDEAPRYLDRMWARVKATAPTPAQDDEWPEPMTLAAFHGPFGEAVAEIMPHTEADPHAILLQLIVFFGNRIGRGPYYRVGPVQHATNLYLLLAGASSRARKGTSEAEVRALFATNPADPWLNNCVQAGLSTGEGLIHAVRDATWGKDKKGDDVLLDAGVGDKRLLVVESEFASVLAVMKREGNTLSPVLRTAWDRDRLQTMTRSSPLKASGTLASVIGHITIDELRGGVDRIALSNGLLNRFVFAAVRRARQLPHGGRLDQAKLQQIGERLNQAARAAQAVGAVAMTGDAADLWSDIYPELTTDYPGLFGSLIARAEAHVVRLALLYALADQRQAIEVVHLEAALAVWRFSEASARLLFGDMIGDPVADALLAALKQAGGAGLSRRDMILLFSRNVDAARIQRALDLLARQGKAGMSRATQPGVPGRPAETWHLIPPGGRP